MKVKYLSTFVTASILSLGLVTACGNPCSGKTDTETAPDATTEVNPCSGKENPCSGKENPCSGKENPCAGQ